MLYIPAWIILACIIVIYIRVFKHVRNPPLIVFVDPEKLKNHRKLFQQLFAFPIAFVCMWIPGNNAL